MEEKLNISTVWDKHEALYVRKKLIEYNLGKINENTKASPDENVSIILKDNDENILGGITGYIHFYCLHVEIFWIDDSLRGQGQGKKLLSIAEEIAVDKGCKLIKLDTFSFQAPDFYKKQGFKVFGVLENYPEGFNHYYLYKNI